MMICNIIYILAQHTEINTILKMDNNNITINDDIENNKMVDVEKIENIKDNNESSETIVNISDTINEKDMHRGISGATLIKCKKEIFNIVHDARVSILKNIDEINLSLHSINVEIDEINQSLLSSNVEID